MIYFTPTHNTVRHTVWHTEVDAPSKIFGQTLVTVKDFIFANAGALQI